MERLTYRREDCSAAFIEFEDESGNTIPAALCRYKFEEKLCAYEDAEEQGLLLRLPCKAGSHVWRVWITDGRKPEITEHYMSDLLHIVQWIDKFGKTVFLTREEAVASIPKEV